jgi:ubiquinone/menaquinone biosynthesis C-methylase UbiE
LTLLAYNFSNWQRLTNIRYKNCSESSALGKLQEVKEHWESETVGTRYSISETRKQFYAEIRQARYELEPFIKSFADFELAAGDSVLEIGVGAGSDFSNWVGNGAMATGIDITAAAVEHTRAHLNSLDLSGKETSLSQANAEELPFHDDSFDLVYSWGVLHHTPDTLKALTEVQRVLRPNGRMKIMVYSKNSWSAWMMWGIHGLLKGKPFKSPRACVYDNLESPGTKSYSIHEAEKLVSEAGFSNVHAWTLLGPGDLLTIKPSKRYQSLLSRMAFAVYPRWIIRALGNRFGLYLLITADKA